MSEFSKFAHIVQHRPIHENSRTRRCKYKLVAQISATAEAAHQFTCCVDVRKVRLPHPFCKFIFLCQQIRPYLKW